MLGWVQAEAGRIGSSEAGQGRLRGSVRTRKAATAMPPPIASADAIFGWAEMCAFAVRNGVVEFDDGALAGGRWWMVMSNFFFGEMPKLALAPR